MPATLCFCTAIQDLLLDKEKQLAALHKEMQELAKYQVQLANHCDLTCTLIYAVNVHNWHSSALCLENRYKSGLHLATRTEPTFVYVL